MGQPVNAFVLVSNAVDGDIRVFDLRLASGTLRPVATVAAGDVVMPLAVACDGKTVFAATRGARMTLRTFALDRVDGALTARETRPIDHSLAYLTTDRAGRYLFGASYGQNLLSVYATHGPRAALQVVEGIEHAHCAIVSPDDRFVYVSALGGDRLLCFAITRDPARPLRPVESLAVERGFGPRHLRFSPSGATLYALSEFRGTIAVFARDVETGKLTAQGASPRPPVLAHLRDGFARPHFAAPDQPDPRVLATSIWAADLQVHPGGRFVYVSERTASLLLVYRVRDGDGALAFVGATDTEHQPRGIRIDPTGRFLLACGERSTRVAVYRIDAATGALALVCQAAGGRGANWIECVAASSIDPPFPSESPT